MVVNPYSSLSVRTNPTSFDSSNRNTLSRSSDTSFEQQLSTVISDSLKQLGVDAGEVNISIRNGGADASRQIVITYNATPTGSTGQSAETPSATAPANTSAPTPTAVLNPFSPTALISPGATAATPAPTTPVSAPTPWSVWTGPADRRDITPSGGGCVTATGAPLIEINQQPACNQYNYAGPAARNPYFTSPSNPLRSGYVLGFENWFTQSYILGANAGPIPANKLLYATEEGAQEALRLVRQYEPDAVIDSGNWSGGPFSSSSPMYYVSLPGGRLVSAGGILASYYNHGWGVTADSDAVLERTLRMV